MPVSAQEARQWAKKNASNFVEVEDLAKAYMAGCERGEYLATHRDTTVDFPNDKQLAEIHRMYVNERLTIKEIAARFNKSERQMTYIVSKYNIRKNVRWSARDINYVCKHLYVDASVQQLAERFHTTTTSIESLYNSHKK